MNSTDLKLTQIKETMSEVDARIIELIGADKYAAYRQGVSQMIAADIINMDATPEELKKIKDTLEAENLAILGEHASEVLELYDERHRNASEHALIQLKRKGTPNRQRVLECLRDLPRRPLDIDDSLSISLFGAVSVHYPNTPKYVASDINKEAFDVRVSCSMLPSNILTVYGNVLYMDGHPTCIIVQERRHREVYILNGIRFNSLRDFVQRTYRPAPMVNGHKRLEDNDYVGLLGTGWIGQLEQLVATPKSNDTEA